MENWLVNFHFLRPWILLLLILPIFFYSRYFHGRNNQSSWEKVCDKKLLPYLLIKGSSTQRKIMARLGLLGILSAIIAAAGPSWNKIEIPSLAPENPVVLVLNMSSEMKKNDLSPSRLERAKFKIKDFLPMLKGTQTGLIVYSSEPFLISPLTDDTQIIANLLPAINFDIMPANGDRLDRAIELAVEKMKAAGYQQGNIILFAPDSGQKFDLALEAAKKAKAQQFYIHVIAVSKDTVEKLKLIAEAGGGLYQNLQTGDNELRMLADSLNTDASPLQESKNWQSVWLDYGYYLLLLPLLCCLYFFRRGILVITLLLAAYPAQASFFKNADQDGLAAFNQQDFQRAADHFKDSKWQGAARYRMGDYEQAYREFAKGNDITSLYNQGNALAKSGKIEEAIKKYEAVLAQAPNHEDAKFNLEYLKRQQEQQQQNQQQQNNNNDQQNDNNQNQDSSGNNEGDNQGDNGDNQNSAGNNGQNNSSGSSGEQENQSDNSPQEDKPQESGQDDGQAPQSGQDDKQSGSQGGMQEQPAGGDEKEDEQPQDQPESGGQNSDNDDEKFDEKGQARAQQYREIPEDPGGLLKAFIYKEYSRNRYNEK